MTGSWDRERFRARYVAQGGSANSARSYVRYLNRAERALGGLCQEDARVNGPALIERAERLPLSAWGDAHSRSDSLSALRKPVAVSGGALRLNPSAVAADTSAPIVSIAQPKALDDTVVKLFQEAQDLGARYYAATGDIAELEACRKLDLLLCDARTPLYDAVDPRTKRRIQIKGRAIDPKSRKLGMMPAVKCDKQVDDVLLVLLHKTSLQAVSIWRATVARVSEKVAGLGSERRRKSGTPSLSQFKSIARRVWPASE